MPTKEDYEEKIKGKSWRELFDLWNLIKARNTPGWDAGKAFEYLVLQMFRLDNADVQWSYSVSLFGDQEVEQIDGSVRIGNMYCLVESKDEDGNISFGPIAKLRSQLLRRPAGTVGLLFSSHAFTSPAIQLAAFALPQAILLWTGDEVERALETHTICRFTEQKFRICVDQGMPDFSIAVS